MAFSLFPNRLLPQVWGQSVGLVAVVLLTVAAVASGELTARAIDKLEEAAVAFSNSAALSFSMHQKRAGITDAVELLSDFSAIPGLNVLAVMNEDGGVDGVIGREASAFNASKVNAPGNLESDNYFVSHQRITYLGYVFGTETEGRIQVWKKIPRKKDVKSQTLYLERDVTDIYRSLHKVISVAVVSIMLGIFVIGFLMHRLIKTHIKGIESTIEFSEVLANAPSPATVCTFNEIASKGTSEVQRLAGSLLKAANVIELQKSELEKSRAYLQNVLNVSIAGVVAFDQQLRIVDFNAASERIFGWKASEALGAHLKLLSADRLNENFRPYFKQFLMDQTGMPMGVPFELKAINKAGETIDVEIVLTQIPFGDEVKISASVLDVTAKKRWLEQLATQRDRAEAASKAKSMFLANMSHELRTPMNGIIGMTELALETNLDEEQREYLETVKRSAKQLMLVVNDVLDYSKIEAGKVKIELIDFHLETLIDDIKGAFSLIAKKKKLSFSIDVDSKIKGEFVGDPARLKQVLFNLLDNAFKFTQQGSVVLKLSLIPAERENGEPSVLFEIQDSGIGIPEDKHHAIFDLFSQAEISTARRFGGTGLGLALCKKLAHSMEGDVWLDSKLGVGTSFFFSAKVVPSATSSEAVGLASDKLANLAFASEKFRGKRVLIAEDDKVNASIITQFLKKLDCKVTLVVDGLEAIEVATREQFDLILIDIAMPGLSGTEVTTRLREWERARSDAGVINSFAHVIALSGSLRAAAREDCLMAGADDYLLKPFTSDQFYATLKAAGGEKPAGRYLALNEKLEVFNAMLGAERLGLDLKTVGELARIFLGQLPQFKSEIASASDMGDKKVLAHWLHSLSGSLLTLGALRTGHFARQLEMGCEQFSEFECKKLIGELLTAIDEVEKEVSLFIHTQLGSAQVNRSPVSA
jgi:PAS domain S-box-containing protein